MMTSPHNARRIEPATATNERGFTLIELMIALTLTLVMTGIAVEALLHTARAATGGAVLTDVNQNLRVAMNVLIRDLIQAGQDIPTGGVPLPNGMGSQPIGRPAPPGATITFDPSWVSIPAITTGASLGPMVNGVQTDMVTILRKDPSIDLTRTENLGVTVAPDGSFADIDPSIAIGGGKGLKSGDLLLFRSAGGNAVQEITSVTGQRVFFAPTCTSNLNQRGAAGGSIMSLQNAGVFPPMSIQRIMLVTYYIKQDSGSAPYLIRKINWAEERVIAVGVENLQLTWDLVDGVTNPANVEQPVTPNTPHQIRKANLHMAARAAEGSATGSYLRSSLNTQIALRSLAFVDRYK